MENSHQYTKPFTTDGPGIPWTDALVDGPPPRQEEPMGVPNTITGPSMSPQQLDATVNASPIIMEGEASPVQGAEAPKTKPRRSRFAPEPDWSEMRRRQVKTKTHRTGQACDRCKLRKLRCDTTPAGCMGCYTVNTPCKVTDRVTGETFIRGAAAQLTALNEQLEIEIAALKEENDLLHAQVAFFQKLYQMDGFDTTTLGSAKEQEQPALFMDRPRLVDDFLRPCGC